MIIVHRLIEAGFGPHRRLTGKSHSASGRFLQKTQYAVVLWSGWGSIATEPGRWSVSASDHDDKAASVTATGGLSC